MVKMDSHYLDRHFCVSKLKRDNRETQCPLK